jgi:ABC-type bacteriocin/lantibiotic exporter with double-glycine peptidase domain
MKSHTQRTAGATLRDCNSLVSGRKLEYFGVAVATSLLAALEGVIHPLLVKIVFDGVVARQQFSHFLELAVAYLGFGLFCNVGYTALAIWNKSFENRLVRQLTRRTLESYFYKDYSYVLQNGYGYFIDRVYGDIREGLIPMLGLGLSLVKACTLLLALSIVLVYLSWQASLYLVMLIPISIALSVAFGKRIRVLAFQEREDQGAVLATLAKVLTAFRIIRSFALIENAGELLDRPLTKYLSTSFRHLRSARLFRSLNDSAMTVADFLSLFVGALFVFKGTLSFGGFVSFVNAFWRAITTTISIFKGAGDYQTFGASVERIVNFVAPSEQRCYVVDNVVVARDVGFSYGTTPVLVDVSLKVSLGERVVIVGKNGTGKTTFANVLAGLISPTDGDVRRPERVSAVTLPICFPPIRVNDLVSDASLLRALGLGSADILNGVADELSAGQQQRLALALALSRDADLYIIDEPLANIDGEGRSVVMNTIMARTKGRMLILIMHGGEEYYPLVDRVVELHGATAADWQFSGLRECDLAVGGLEAARR